LVAKRFVFHEKKSRNKHDLIKISTFYKRLKETKPTSRKRHQKMKSRARKKIFSYANVSVTTEKQKQMERKEMFYLNIEELRSRSDNKHQLFSNEKQNQTSSQIVRTTATYKVKQSRTTTKEPIQTFVRSTLINLF
jgi:hypothetical protein